MRRGALAAAMLSMALLAPAGAAQGQGVYIAEGGAVTGPFDAETMKGKLGTQASAAGTLVWMQGMAGWQAATEVPALAGLVAELPAEVPFEADFLAGSWESADQPISSGHLTVMGRMRIDFAAEGTFTGTMLGSHVSTTYQPGQKPGESIQQQERLSLNSRIRGRFVVKQEVGGFLNIALTGEEEATEDGKVYKFEQVLDVRREGPDLIRSRYGVVWRRMPWRVR
jgi:hypothetical protein